MIRFRRQVLPVIIGVILVFVLGTVGYMWIEGWTFWDALYMTVITLTTTGFSEVNPLSTQGRVFTMLLLGVGLGIVLYAVTLIGEYIITARLGESWRSRYRMRQIEELTEHTIICGLGRVGWSTATTLQQMGKPVLIIDTDEEELLEAEKLGFEWVSGDATEDATLKEAGIERAAGVVAATGKDPDNLVIVLSARALNPDLFIVSRSTLPENESKMLRAGADRVVSPYRMGGQHMANLMIRPQIVEFLNNVTVNGGQELWMEEISIRAGSQLEGQTVVDANIRRQTGVNLIALRPHSTEMMRIPDEEMELAVDDTLIVLGTRGQLASLEKLVNP